MMTSDATTHSRQRVRFVGGFATPCGEGQRFVMLYCAFRCIQGARLDGCSARPSLPHGIDLWSGPEQK
jgi:hypothetical protein